jgi:hypothetical protein
MTRAELDYAFFRRTGIRPPACNAPRKEQEDFQKVLEIRLDLLNQEVERRKKAATRQAK